MLVFGELGKAEYPEKKPLRAEEITNKLNPLMTPGPGIEPGHTGGRRALSTLRHHDPAPFLCSYLM